VDTWTLWGPVFPLLWRCQRELSLEDFPPFAPAQTGSLSENLTVMVSNDF
jgi:hypothetical protein